MRCGFNAMRALSTRNDRTREGLKALWNGTGRIRTGRREGAILILEEMGRALERGAKIYAEVIGFGASGDAFHMAAPAPEGEGAVRCMQKRLGDAGISPFEVDYINAHGTSTDLNDKYETQAIDGFFRSRQTTWSEFHKIHDRSSVGAAGGIEAAYTVLAIERQTMPPLSIMKIPDPECDLDYVPNQPRQSKITAALSNSFGFGGTNGTLVFSEVERRIVRFQFADCMVQAKIWTM